MTTYAGVTCEAVFERIAAEGQFVKEYLGVLTGDGNPQTFLAKNFPITDNAGVATDAETNVNVYTRPNTTSVTWTELSDAGAEFTIVGATGAVTIAAAKNQAGDAGKLVSIEYWYKCSVLMGQSIVVAADRELKPIHKLGSADVQEIKALVKQPIKITVKNYYVNRDLYGKLFGETDFYKELNDISFYLYPGGTGSTQPRIKVGNVKAKGHGLNAAVNDIISEDLSLEGIALTVDTVP